MAVTIPAGDNDAPAYRPRSYQVEMFEASLKENIIVTVWIRPPGVAFIFLREVTLT